MSHFAFLKRLTDLTRNQAVVWNHDQDEGAYLAHVDTYTARLAYPKGAKPGSALVLRFSLYRRDEVAVEISSRNTLDFQSSNDAAYVLKTLFEAVQRQQASREVAAFEDFLTRAEAS